MNFNLNKRGQVAIYVIIALVIVGLIVAFFALRNQIFVTQISPELRACF